MMPSSRVAGLLATTSYFIGTAQGHNTQASFGLDKAKTIAKRPVPFNNVDPNSSISSHSFPKKRGVSSQSCPQSTNN